MADIRNIERKEAEAALGRLQNVGDEKTLTELQKITGKSRRNLINEIISGNPEILDIAGTIKAKTTEAKELWKSEQGSLKSKERQQAESALEAMQRKVRESIGLVPKETPTSKPPGVPEEFKKYSTSPTGFVLKDKPSTERLLLPPGKDAPAPPPSVPAEFKRYEPGQTEFTLRGRPYKPGEKLALPPARDVDIVPFSAVKQAVDDVEKTATKLPTKLKILAPLGITALGATYLYSKYAGDEEEKKPVEPPKVTPPAQVEQKTKTVDKSVNETKKYVVSASLPKSVKDVFTNKLNQLESEWQTAQSRYKEDQDRVEFGKMLDLLARSLGQIGAGLYGLQNGVDAVTGLKFNPIDWSDTFRRIEGDRDIAFKQYLTSKAEVKSELKEAESAQRELAREQKALDKETEAEKKFTDTQLRAELKDKIDEIEKKKSAMQLASAYISADPARAKDRPRLIQGLREEMAKAGIDAQEQDKVLTREASFFGLIQGKEQIDPEKLSNEIRSRVSQFNSELDRLKKLRYSPTRLTEQQVRSPESQPAPSQEKPSIDISKLPAVVEMVKPNGDIIEVPKKDIERALRGGATFPKGKYE